MGNPAFRPLVQSGPVGRTLLPATAQGPPPEARHPIPKDPQAVQISRYRMVVEVALYDRPEPFAGLRHRIVHPPSELLLDLLQLGPCRRLRIVLRRTVKAPFRVFPLMCVKPRKSNVSGLPSPRRFRFELGVPSELDPARFVGMQFQSKLPQPFPEILQRSGRLRSATETRGPYRRRNAPRPRLLGRASCATPAPRGRRRNADRYSRAAARSPPPAAYPSPSPTIRLPPELRPLTISG